MPITPGNSWQKDEFFFRDAPEPTGEETEDADLDAPKIYETVN